MNGLCQATHANTTRHGVLENITRRTERDREDMEHEHLSVMLQNDNRYIVFLHFTAAK